MTLTLDRVNLSTAHRKEKGQGEGEQAGSKPPMKLGPADASVYTREDGTTVQLCGDSEVVGKWINGKNSLGQTYQEKWDDSEPMVGKEDGQPFFLRLTTIFITFFGNTIQRPIIGPMWALKDRGQRILGWQLQGQWEKWVRCGHQRSLQRKMDHDQQNFSSSERWYSRGGQNDGCVRAHGNPGSGFPQTSV